MTKPPVPAPAGGARRLPRGIRNNNPGNIRRIGTPTPWRGLSKDQSADPAFLVFDAPLWGLRALARTLHTYWDKYRLKTVRGIITRWAPPEDGNDTGAYVAQVAAALKVRPDAPIEAAPETWVALMRAIVRHENGVGDYYPIELYWEAAREGLPKPQQGSSQ